MAKKIKISQLEEAKSLDNLWIFGKGPGTTNLKAPMSLLRGNTAFQEWLQRNPGKTYEDWIKLLQEPAQLAADGISEIKQNLTEFETEAKKAETLRENAEKDRITAEGARTTFEQARESNEKTRVTNETARINTEKSRVTAESGRVDAEKLRVTAENKRQTDTTEALQKSATATKKATDAADRSNILSDHRDEIRDGYWWRWDESTKEWYNTGEIAKGNVMYATFNVNPATGELEMLTDPEYTGANFSLENGVLIVEI